MKLSEAIRLGAMLKPQAFGLCYSDGRTCAMGAAWDAIGKLHVTASDPSIDFGDSYWAVAGVSCPVCGRASGSGMAVAHLNDDHRWTREQIADWVETIERAQEPPVPSCDSSDARTQGHAVATPVALCAPK